MIAVVLRWIGIPVNEGLSLLELLLEPGVKLSPSWMPLEDER